MELYKGQEYGKLYNNSMSVSFIDKNATFHVMTKQIQLRYHFICTLLEGGHISLDKIHTIKNHVNMLIKVITQEKLKLCLASA